MFEVIKKFFSAVGHWLFGNFGEVDPRTGKKSGGVWRLTWIAVIAGIGFLIFAAIYWGR